MIKIAICDDEPLVCQLLKSSCSHNLFLLDIQMPDQDGITLAKKSGKTKSEV